MRAMMHCNFGLKSDEDEAREKHREMFVTRLKVSSRAERTGQNEVYFLRKFNQTDCYASLLSCTLYVGEIKMILIELNVLGIDSGISGKQIGDSLSHSAPFRK